MHLSRIVAILDFQEKLVGTGYLISARLVLLRQVTWWSATICRAL